MPPGWDTTNPKDLIVATDGSVLFSIRYHIWAIATSDEEILLKGGGPDEGNPLLMISYRSEVGGLGAGLAVLCTITPSDLINTRSVKCVCDNKLEIIAIKQ
jgi:hypothetical protein